MFEKQKKASYNIEIKELWKFLINYNWGNLMKGYSVISEKNKWIVQLENKKNSNIQIVEMFTNQETYLLSIKITPKFNKHQSYDLITVSLESDASSTLVKIDYEYHPMSIVEKIFARLLNKEDNIFEEYANEIFHDITQELLTEIYG